MKSYIEEVHVMRTNRQELECEVLENNHSCLSLRFFEGTEAKMYSYSTFGTRSGAESPILHQ